MIMRRIKVLVCFFTLLSMCQSGADIARFGVFVVDDKTGKALKNVIAPAMNYCESAA